MPQQQNLNTHTHTEPGRKNWGEKDGREKNTLATKTVVRINDTHILKITQLGGNAKISNFFQRLTISSPQPRGGRWVNPERRHEMRLRH